MRELILASGPDRYFGGTIETFALPYGAFIVIALTLWYIFRHPHSVPRMKYLTPANQTSLGTREPGAAGVTRFSGRLPADALAPDSDVMLPAEADTSVPAGQPPHASEAHPDASEVILDPAAHTDEPAAGDQQEGDA